MSDLLRKYLATCLDIPKPKTDLDEFCNYSNQFQSDFPTNKARFSHLRRFYPEEELEKVIHSAYPIVHERVLPLIVDFIQYKQRNGTRKEREVYEGISLLSFVDRIIRYRPVTFYGSEDRYLLHDFSKGYGGFDVIGTEKEKYPIILKDFMSYDEMKIAALFNLSSESFFINDGARTNAGEPGKEGTFTPHGVIMAQIGARMKRKDVMEWQDIVITDEQNNIQNGYGQNGGQLPAIWGKLWDTTLPLYREAFGRKDKFKKINVRTSNYKKYPQERPPITLFNVDVYMQRTILSAETLLIDANERAKSFKKKAYVHVVGLGLGVWRVDKFQEQMYVDAWGRAISNVDTSGIGVIDFSWIDVNDCLSVKNNEIFPNTDVKIVFSKRNLHDLVPDGMFLFCNFAWDSNSLPGNEYWTYKTASTGDSAAASSSCVAEVQNHFINRMLYSDNLHIATKYGVFHIADYAKHYLENSFTKPQKVQFENVSSNVEKYSNFTRQNMEPTPPNNLKETATDYWNNECNSMKDSWSAPVEPMASEKPGVIEETSCTVKPKTTDLSKFSDWNDDDTTNLDKSPVKNDKQTPSEDIKNSTSEMESNPKKSKKNKKKKNNNKKPKQVEEIGEYEVIDFAALRSQD